MRLGVVNLTDEPPPFRQVGGSRTCAPATRTGGVPSSLGVEAVADDRVRRHRVGGSDDIMALLQSFRTAGVHLLILRSIATGIAEMLSQTRLLIERVLPEVAALN